MKKIAYLFPGQGAQYVGMGKDFAENFAIARETFEEADDILGFRLSKIVFEGPEDLLTQTKYSQLAIFVTSMAIFRVLRTQTSLKPAVCAGLSLGEYSALCASGKLSFKEALLLIQKRAEFMQEAAEKMGGTMAAVLGMISDDVESTLKPIAGVWVANYNCPGQIVISGTKEGVAKGSEALKMKGAKRVIQLAVSGAFHCPLMESAKLALAPFITSVSLQETDVQLVMNVPGDFVTEPAAMRSALISQVTDSVRFEQGIRAIQSAGIDAFIEIGPGKTLSGMLRKIGEAKLSLSLDRVQDLDEVLCNC